MHNFLNKKIKYIGIITLLGYILLIFISLIGLYSHGHSGIPMVDCPYSLDTHSLCPMELLMHLETWKNLFKIIPSSLILLIVILILYNIPKLKINKQIILFLRNLSDKHRFLYTELFSSGILNPKAP